MNPQHNNIAQDQNSPRKMDQLAAKSQLYGLVEKIQLGQAMLPVLNALVWPPLLALKPELKVWSALTATTVPFLDVLLFETLQKSWKTQAAKIQEVFDCELLGLKWKDSKCGSPPTQEAILESARAYRRGGGSEKWLRDWYSFDFADLPIPFARLICQRSNCWWDTKLRRTYANIIIGAICLLATFALCIGIATNLTLEKFILAVVAPMAPVCIWGIREATRQRNTADDGDGLLQHAESLWKKACNGLITGVELEEASRELQCEIYDRRRNSPVNPAWLYSNRRDEYQELMVKGAQELIQQYKQKQCG